MVMGVHINRPSSTRFQARVRFRGHRRYILVGKPTKTLRSALVKLSIRFASEAYKRGDVLLTADYYDPQLVAELVRA